MAFGGGGTSLAASGTQAAPPRPAWSAGRPESPDQEDDIARPLEEFPHGRPPLTRDQTVRAYARMMGVHPSEVDPEKMELKRDIRFEPVQRRERGMYGGDAEPGPFNEPYDPESDAVRGGNWKRLDPDLAGRVRERIQGTRFEGMDLDGLKIHDSEKPWYMPGFAGGITLENHIYIDPSGFDGNRFDPGGRQEDFDVLLEEVIHSGQYQSGMTRAGYLWDAFRRGGYEHSAYEREAKDIAIPGWRERTGYKEPEKPSGEASGLRPSSGEGYNK
ncbi:hypothetical protein NNJEOMEG_03471 [Fundidesulfovibrio magnetotacticus]|uniref:Uncharacterized protein n=1 Tax=Fundidesulfovibrio magnetotacticus TaxID=2730080 RepID=A0A6V8LT11_9BACT|nr:hypothetical protein [Fundidesulfovibrio magnetotacticus]GFK95603.1 hypothetical protein NNJEOMEG_03471 [Fundidesulfovibrio magnetotacticus]